MNEKKLSPRFDGVIRGLGILGGILAALSIIAGILMLLMTGAQLNPPYFLTWMVLLVLPLAFMLMLFSLLLLWVRRRF